MDASKQGVRALARSAGAALLVVLAAGCADPRHPVGLSVAGSDVPLTLSQNVGLRASEVFSDGTSDDVTAATDWASSDSTVATVAGGTFNATVTAHQPGTVAVTATYRELSATVHFTVPVP